MKSVFFVTDASQLTDARDDATTFVEISLDSADRLVQKTIASEPDSTVFVNAVPANHAALCAKVAHELELARVSWCGVRERFLRYDRAQMYMALHYEGLPVAPHRMCERGMSESRVVDGLKFPLSIRDPLPTDTSELVAEDVAAFGKLVDEQRTQRTRFVVEEHTPGATMTVQAFGSGRKQEVVVVKDDDVSGDFAARIQKAFANVFEATGCVTFLIRHAPDASEERYVVVDVLTSVTPRGVAVEHMLNAAKKPVEPTFAVSFHPQMRGYHVAAAKALPKGTIVFHDEGHAFPIVTKGHVKSAWSSEDQETFTRYAWPLDSDAHVYAVWENDPTTWRPINHSCDPNLVFAEMHSLNVIASRDIAAGEDLTLDYTTFCDQSMEPFDCFCGAPCCRKRIFPDEENLKRFGGNAWHRKLPKAN